VGRTSAIGCPDTQGHWISRVETSRHDPAVAYVTATGYRSDDFRPFAWKTSDYGQTWTSIAGNLPDEAINAIREDHKNPNLLFVGTEPGLHVTMDGGRTWHDLQGNMPTNPVYDLQVHPRENELIVATHGRGIFIADITGLQGLTPATLASDAALVDIQPAVQWVRGQTGPLQRSTSQESRPAAGHSTTCARLRATSRSGCDGARMIAEVGDRVRPAQHGALEPAGQPEPHPRRTGRRAGSRRPRRLRGAGARGQPRRRSWWRPGRDIPVSRAERGADAGAARDLSGDPQCRRPHLREAGGRARGSLARDPQVERTGVQSALQPQAIDTGSPMLDRSPTMV
jgi:hypothetical protein